MTRRIRIALLAAGCTLAAAPALAAGEQQAQDESKADVERMQATESLQRAESQCGHFWTLIDTDDDLQVSAEEARAAADKVMEGADIDRSGDIGPDEYAECAARGAETAAVESATRNRSMKRFAEYDVDGDGRVSVQEMLTAAEGEFLGADTDSDRVLSAAELREMSADETRTTISEMADISGDERISADEMAAQVRREFLTTDRDHDGGIDAEEWQSDSGSAAGEAAAGREAGERARRAAPDQFGQLDYDESGAITRDEIQRFTVEEWGAAARQAEESQPSEREQQATGQTTAEQESLGSVWIFRIYRFE